MRGSRSPLTVRTRETTFRIKTIVSSTLNGIWLRIVLDWCNRTVQSGCRWCCAPSQLFNIVHSEELVWKVRSLFARLIFCLTLLPLRVPLLKSQFHFKNATYTSSRLWASLLYQKVKGFPHYFYCLTRWALSCFVFTSKTFLHQSHNHRAMP